MSELHAQDHDPMDDCPCGDPGCAGCDDGWDEPDDGTEDYDACPDCRSSYCMGDCMECAFPDRCVAVFGHMRSECATAEMMEEYMNEAHEPPTSRREIYGLARMLIDDLKTVRKQTKQALVRLRARSPYESQQLDEAIDRARATLDELKGALESGVADRG